MSAVNYLHPAQAGRLWPNGASPARVIRAILTPKKLRQRPGETIRLRAVRDSQGWLTTQEWVEDYLATLTADRLDMSQSARHRLRRGLNGHGQD